MTSAEMIPKETAPTTVPANEAVQFPVVSLGTPQGVVRNKTISPNSKPPEEAVYPAGRLVLIALVVVVSATAAACRGMIHTASGSKAVNQVFLS